MEMTLAAMWLAMGVAVVPVLGWLLWWWNDIWHGFWVKAGGSNTKLPPGHMGLPVVGEMLTFLWYFKFLRRPDDYNNSKRTKYGEQVGMYRSHLFGGPCIIACSPSANKFVFQSEETFSLQWPNADIVDETSLVSVNGPSHARLRTFVTRSINQPDALRRIACMVQPRMINALRSWAKTGRITAHKEVKQMTFENIGKYFASFEPGPVIDSLENCFVGLVTGIRAAGVKIPGTAYHHALQEELEKRKTLKEYGTDDQSINDLLGGLMQLKDDEGKHLRDAEVLDNIVSLLVAGYESTALASTWAIYYLAKYPKVLHKLQEETMALRKSKNEELVTCDEIVKLKYTNKVVEETIRLTNVAPFVFRTATKDTEYKGYKIPKGLKVICWVRYLHTDPENFKDPQCFNPERWDATTRPGTYQVFGGGSRICAGNMLALVYNFPSFSTI